MTRRVAPKPPDIKGVHPRHGASVFQYSKHCTPTPVGNVGEGVDAESAQ